MATRRGRLSAKQQKVLEALLVGGSDQQAAVAGGVSRPTVTNWRNRSESFKAALDEARRDLLRRTTARLHAATTIAVRALEDVAKDPRNPAPRIAAARAIIEFSQKAIELEDLERRVNELEAEIKGDDEAKR